MTEVADLLLRVDSSQVKKGETALRGLEQQGARTEKATDGLTGAFTKLIGPLAASISIATTLGKLISVQREFDVLNAGLVTVTGSTEGAAIAFEALQDFAGTTPYSLQQVTDSFIKLGNYGLEPSERALTSYGNTASAMGKDLNMLIEAVADAATGEFERLKDFGIKAKKNGDEVSLTFRGVTTNIKNNAEEIQGYLIALGENQFAGNMQARMDTLDGAISNLGDEWDKVFLNISKSGIGDLIGDGVRAGIEALSELNAMLASGEMEGYLEAIAAKFAGYGDDMAATWDTLGDLLQHDTNSVVSDIIDAFESIPENVRALVRIVVVEVLSAFDRLSNAATFYGDAIRAQLNPFDDNTIIDAYAKYAKEQQRILGVREDSIVGIMNERNAAHEASAQAVKDAEAKRKAYEAEQDAKKQKKGDRLAGFGLGATGNPAASADAEAAADAKRKKKEFDNLKESLQTEEEEIRASYDRRKAIIEANTAAGSAARSDLMSRLDKENKDKLDKLSESQGRELEQVRTSLLKEEEALSESYQRRMDIIVANTEEGSALRAKLQARLEEEHTAEVERQEQQRQAKKDALYADFLTEDEALVASFERKKEVILQATEVTELERQDLLRKLQDQFDAERSAAQMQVLSNQVQNAGNMFGALAELAKQSGGEQSKAYKALFAVSKAFNIAKAVMDVASGIAAAQKLSYPMNIIEGIRVAAVGATQIAAIRSASYTEHDQGGRIPAGKIGIVGEYGPEFVRGPAAITGRQLTAQTLGGGGGGSGVNFETHINVNQDGATSNTKGDDESNARALNALINSRVQEIIVRESRQGGLMWRLQNGR